MKKTLWTIFKMVTFGIGILFYIGLAMDFVKSFKKPRPIMFMNQK